MKEIITVDTSVSRERAHSGWQTLVKSYLEPLNPVSVHISPYGMVVTFIFGYYPEQLDHVFGVLDRHRINATVYERREYQPQELLLADYLDLGTERVVHSVPGTLRSYLIPVCSFCGFKESPWILPEIRIKRKPNGYELARVDHHPEVVSSALAAELKAATFTGLELVPLGDVAEPDWYALSVDHRLPPLLSPPTRLKKLANVAPNPHCVPDHNFNSPRSELAYRRDGFEALDFNTTFEVFGDSETCARRMIISSRVYRLLVKLKVKQLACEPIRLVD